MESPRRRNEPKCVLCDGDGNVIFLEYLFGALSAFSFQYFHLQNREQRQDESADTDPEPAQDEREGVGGRGGGDQELLALRVQGLGLDLPRRSALRDDGRRRHLHVFTIRRTGKFNIFYFQSQSCMTFDN